jgi:hypothetical protein
MRYSFEDDLIQSVHSLQHPQGSWLTTPFLFPQVNPPMTSSHLLLTPTHDLSKSMFLLAVHA